MQYLLTAIVTWLSINYGLPADYDHPQVRFLPPIEIAFLHYDAATPAARNKVRVAYAFQRTTNETLIASAYDSRHNTILLPNGWTGKTPGELSLLVHEMVHHLQGSAGLRYPCPQEREKLAYMAQDKWLGLSRTSLENEFQIDALTVFVLTHCM
jgi:hypothetical protein